MKMQEPGANASEIYSVLRHVRPGDNFVPNFEMFAKSDVNGKDQNPIYEFLKSRCPSVRAEFQASYKLYYEPYHQDDIRWGDTNHPIKKYSKISIQVEFWKVPGEPPGSTSASLWRITWSIWACKYPRRNWYQVCQPPCIFQVPDIDVLLGQCELDLAE